MKNKLTAGQIKPYREEQLRKQGSICPLCHTRIEIGEATLDHCHESGLVRQVLHRSCNGAEGRILSWAGQRSKGNDPVYFLENLIKYWGQNFGENPLHPKHGVKKKRRTSGKKSKPSTKTTRKTSKKSPRMKATRATRSKR